MKHYSYIATSFCLALFVCFVIGLFMTSQAVDNASLDKALREGAKLSKTEADTFEKQLAHDPDNLDLHCKLLSYYFHRSTKDEFFNPRYYEHGLWFIRKHPDKRIVRIYVQFNPVLSRDYYNKAEALWKKHLVTHKKNPAVLGNAGNFFMIWGDTTKAKQIFKEAQKLEPNNPEWNDMLGQLYRLETISGSKTAKQDNAAKSLQQYEASLAKKTTEQDRFYMLSNLAEAAFNAGDLSKAEKYATELLKLSGSYKSDWNYGNAIHTGNIVLGRIALKTGDLKKAEKYLLEAGHTPGSPQLNSFGPDRNLAKELLEKGSKAVVIEYLTLCSIFWKSQKEKLDNWIATIKGGGTPDLCTP